MFKKILSLYIIWRISLFFVAFLSIYFIPQFGARFPYYESLILTGLPYWIWGFANFDGVHYLTIASSGYVATHTQVFFPLYPLLMSILSVGENYVVSGLLISNILFIFLLISLYKLFRLDFDHRISLGAILILLFFPTSFYFGAIYTESLFLLLSTLSIYFWRKERYLIAGIFAMLASATRVFGVLLAVIFLIEYFEKHRKEKFKANLKLVYKPILGLLLVPIGLLSYMLYLKINFNNSLYFLSSQPAFGAERSDQPFILLPQVIFRYIKIFLTVPANSPAFYTAVSEFAFTAFAIILIILSYKKIRLSYLVFSAISIIIPTLTGTLSSMPRYALMAFLLFPTLPIIFGRYLYYILPIFAILQIIMLAFFIRGYWIA